MIRLAVYNYHNSQLLSVPAPLARLRYPSVTSANLITARGSLSEGSGGSRGAAAGGAASRSKFMNNEAI